MRERIDAFDWASTPVGPRERWPQSLRTLVELCLACRFPMMFWWGPELTYFYNDAYAPILGHRHPSALGQNGRVVWEDLWPVLKPQVDAVLLRGESTWNDRVKLVIDRTGTPEDNWFTWSYCPIYDESGKIAGLFNTCKEDTREVRLASERDDQLDRVQAAEARVRAILESISDAFISFDREWRFIYVNPQTDLMLGSKPGQLLGKSLFDLFPGMHGSVFETAYRRTMDERVPTRTVAFYQDHQRWYDVSAYPSAEGISLFVRDVTEQENIRLAARRSDQRLQQVTDATPVMVWAATPDGTIDYYNRRFYDFLGVDVSTPAVDIDWRTFVHPEDLERVSSVWSSALVSGEGFQIEFRMRDSTRRYRWLLSRAQPSLNATGQIERWYGTCTDIEDRRRDDSRNRFLVMLDEATRPLTNAVEITATHARLLGEFLSADRCAYADVEGDQDTFNLTGDYNRGVPSIIGRYRFGQFGAEVLRLMRAGQPFICPDVETYEPALGDLSAYRATMIRAVICVPLQKGERFVAAMAVHQTTPRAWTAEEVALVRHVAGRCWESIERARIERTLRESEARFRSMADAAPVMIWTVGVDGGATWFNKSWLEFTGTTLESQLGNGWLDGIHPDDLDRASQTWSDAFERHDFIDMDYRVRHRDGQYRWILDRGTPRYGADDVFVGYVGSCLDITDRKRVEEQQQSALAFEQAARRDAEESGRMKDEFLATLSHELRTPLSAILGWSQILRRSGTRPQIVEEGLATIERNARVQTQIIEDLLDMSRIVSGKLSLNARPIDLAGVIRAAIETVRAATEAKAIQLRFEAPHNMLPVLGDMNRLQQVFWNLLSNAIKFTPHGGMVCVNTRREGDHWLIDVIDTGEGISESFLPFVFDRFRQADASTTRRHGGLGLGLAIVKQLVELHGGEVTVESAGPGLGATFTVRMPVRNVPVDSTVATPGRLPGAPDADLEALREQPMWDASPCDDLRGLRILVVDDEPDARALLQRLLTDCDATVDVAADADEALAMLGQGVPDLLVSDIGMPGRDGHALIRQIRSWPRERGGAMPAIALTAYARAEDRVKALRSGFQMHVPKPVEPAELIAAIASLVKREQISRDGVIKS
jgi:PAS domain S-box-containing protein